MAAPDKSIAPSHCLLLPHENAVATTRGKNRGQGLPQHKGSLLREGHLRDVCTVPSAHVSTVLQEASREWLKGTASPDVLVPHPALQCAGYSLGSVYLLGRPLFTL